MLRDSLSELLRPKVFSDLLQPDHVIKWLEEMAASKTPENILFYGSPGLGKTSAARILLSELGDNWFEFNGSLDVDIVSKIKTAATSCGLGDGPRVCFIDEAEFLSKKHQAGLRGLIELVHSNCRFLLTANKIDKFDDALKSRCLPVWFGIPVTGRSEIIARVLPRYLRRLRELNVEIQEQRVRELFRVHFPDLRALANRIQFETLTPAAMAG